MYDSGELIIDHRVSEGILGWGVRGKELDSIEMSSCVAFVSHPYSLAEDQGMASGKWLTPFRD